MASDDAITSFAQDGVAIIRSIVRPGQLTDLAASIDTIRAQSSSSEDHFLSWQSSDIFRAIALESPVPQHAADFLDSFQIRLHHDRVVGSGGPSEPLWRQDQPFSPVSSASITAWVVAENVAKGDSPEFWAGSHLGSWYLPDGTVDAAPEGQNVLAMPDLVEDEASYDTRRWALEPGDVVFASSLTVYSIPPSFAQYRAVAFNYVDADAVHRDRSWPTVPDLTSVGGLTYGEPLNDEQYPQAWPQV